MRKAADKTTNIDDVERSLIALSAKRQFISAAMNMGWQLAFTVLVPVIIGVKLDAHFHTDPSYTLAALILATTGVVAVVWSTIKQVGREQAKELKEDKK